MKKKKHKRKPEPQSTLNLGFVDSRLAEGEKMLRAQLEARKSFKDITGQELPLECFKVQKDAEGDYFVTITEEATQ